MCPCALTPRTSSLDCVYCSRCVQPQGFMLFCVLALVLLILTWCLYSRLPRSPNIDCWLFLSSSSTRIPAILSHASTPCTDVPVPVMLECHTCTSHASSHFRDPCWHSLCLAYCTSFIGERNEHRQPIVHLQLEHHATPTSPIESQPRPIRNDPFSRTNVTELLPVDADRLDGHDCYQHELKTACVASWFFMSLQVGFSGQNVPII